MILLYNVYLDNKSLTQYDRGRYKVYSTLEIFLYTLYSVCNLYPWSKVIINVEHCSEYNNLINILYKKIEILFQNYSLQLNKIRCTRQSHWIKLSQQLDDELIFFHCNHDHVFIDNDTQSFRNFINEFETEYKGSYSTIYTSHWPELLKNHYNFNHIFNKNYFLIKFATLDSLQIVTSKYFRDMWSIGSFEELYFPRTDWCGAVPNNFGNLLAIGYKEYFRHFDGYSHSNLNQINNCCPPLIIPNGFFDNNIKLKFGFDNNDTECFNINIKKENYSSIDSNGTDAKIFRHEIPYFWKNHISSIEMHIDYDESKLILQRKLSIDNMLKFNPIKDELRKRIYNAYNI